MIRRDEALALRRPYQSACTKVWNAAQREGVELHHAMGFFTALDWLQIAHEELSQDALNLVMSEIASRYDLRSLLEDEIPIISDYQLRQAKD